MLVEENRLKPLVEQKQRVCTLIPITLWQETELLDAGWKHFTGATGKAKKKKKVTIKFTVNTRKIYYLLSTYYVQESILHVPHHIIPTRPFGENSAIASMLQ